MKSINKNIFAPLLKEHAEPSSQIAPGARGCPGDLGGRPPSHPGTRGRR